MPSHSTLLRLCAAFALTVFAISAAPARAQTAEQAGDPGTSLSAAKKKHRAVRQDGGGQIACTVYGCHRISRRCTPTTEYNFWGNPTGFDAIACR